MGASFLPSESEDQGLEEANGVFWDALITRMRTDGFTVVPRRVLDVGCHRGGLLERICGLWEPSALYGVEPVPALRKRAQLRLRSRAAVVEIFDKTEWNQIPTAGVDLVTCFEVLHLVADLNGFFASVARVLGEYGRAYVVLGCHIENPVWASWKPQLQAMGHEVFDHAPMDILRAGAAYGMLPSVRPLRDAGWVTHDPRDPVFSFPSVGAMLDHQFRHKLLFRFARP